MSLSDHKNIIKTIHPGSLWAGYKYIEQIFLHGWPWEMMQHMFPPPATRAWGKHVCTHCTAIYRRRGENNNSCLRALPCQERQTISHYFLLVFDISAILRHWTWKGQGWLPAIYLQMFINHINMFLHCYYEQYEMQQLTLVSRSDRDGDRTWRKLRGGE